MKKKVKKEITFYCNDKIELQCCEPIIAEAQIRGYKTLVTDNKYQKSEIGLYCSHVNFPEFSKLSLIMLHDLGQQHGFWPDIWKNEYWNIFDIGLLPSHDFVNMWKGVSCYKYTRPRIGCFYAGWPKADRIGSKTFNKNCEEIISKYRIDKSKKTVLYAPSWEYDGRQLEIIDYVKDLNCNLVIKQFPATLSDFPEQYRIINEMNNLSQNIKNVYILDSTINIFDAINISDVLVSEESSTLYESMLLGKPVIAVTDWLVPDQDPPRFPDFPDGFVNKTSKSALKEIINLVLNDNSYTSSIREYKHNNFTNIGKSASDILNLIDSVINNKLLYGVIEPLKKKIIPRSNIASVNTRKKMRFKLKVKDLYINNSRFLTILLKLYKRIKCHHQ